MFLYKREKWNTSTMVWSCILKLNRHRDERLIHITPEQHSHPIVYMFHPLHNLWIKIERNSSRIIFGGIFFLAFDFCRFCVVIRFFHPRHNGQWPPTSKDFLSQILSITFFFYLNSSERASFSLLMLSAKQGNYWYPFYYVFGTTQSLSGDWTRDLPHTKPALYH